MKKFSLGEPTIYTKEIDQLLKETLRKDWMSEGDWEEFLCLLNKSGITYKLLTEQISQGIKNGYTLDYQINVCREYIKNNFSDT